MKINHGIIAAVLISSSKAVFAEDIRSIEAFTHTDLIALALSQGEERSDVEFHLLAGVNSFDERRRRKDFIDVAEDMSPSFSGASGPALSASVFAQYKGYNFSKKAHEFCVPVTFKVDDPGIWNRYQLFTIWFGSPSISDCDKTNLRIGLFSVIGSTLIRYPQIEDEAEMFNNYANTETFGADVTCRNIEWIDYPKNYFSCGRVEIKLYGESGEFELSINQ